MPRRPTLTPADVRRVLTPTAQPLCSIMADLPDDAEPLAVAELLDALVREGKAVYVNGGYAVVTPLK